MIKEELNNKFDGLSEQEKTLFLGDISSFLFDTQMKQMQKYKATIEQNAALEKKIELAQKLIDDLHKEVVKTEKATINSLNKKMQIIRDRLVVIALIAQSLQEQILNRDNQSVAVDSMNNILASIDIIVDDMETLGLWKNDGVKPNTKRIEI